MTPIGAAGPSWKDWATGVFSNLKKGEGMLAEALFVYRFAVLNIAAAVFFLTIGRIAECLVCCSIAYSNCMAIEIDSLHELFKSLNKETIDIREMKGGEG